MFYVVRFSQMRYYETPMWSDVPRCSPMWSNAVIKPTVSAYYIFARTSETYILPVPFPTSLIRWPMLFDA